MKKNLPFEFLFQIISLIIAVILVHLIYVTVIRPNADAILDERAARTAAGDVYEEERSFYVVLRDYELGRKGENQKVKRSSKTISLSSVCISLIAESNNNFAIGAKLPLLS